MKFGLLPYGGDALVKRRLAGHDPRDMVIVSFVGFVPAMFTLNSTKFVAQPDRSYDWRFLTGLELCLLVQPGIHGIGSVIDRICAAVKPHSTVHAWDIERLVGAEFFYLPTADSILMPRPDLWKWQVEALPWLPSQNEEYLIS